MEGLIFKIQKYCIDDGPGIRTTVFFKGCPLKCLWCHNPESQNFNKEWFFDKNKCILCGNCEKVCSGINIKENIFFNLSCNFCGKCIDYCPPECRQISGFYISSDNLLNEILKDEIFFKNSNGGVTFSGGEPLSQYSFLIDSLMKLNEKNVNCCIDTSGYVETEKILSVSEYTDIFLYDIKSMDDFIHKKYTGVSNKLIIKNLMELSKIHSDIKIRIPLIKGINDDEKNILSIVDMMKSFKLTEAYLLPYHEYGVYKYDLLNKAYNLDYKNKLNNDIIENIQNIFDNNKLKLFIKR
jgi:pyruvate formate lyase activating enzyme